MEGDRRELRVGADRPDRARTSRRPARRACLHQLDAHDRVLVEEAARVLAVGADPADDGREVDDDVGPAVGEGAIDAVAVAQVVLRLTGARRSRPTPAPRRATTRRPRNPPPPVTITRRPARSRHPGLPAVTRWSAGASPAAARSASSMIRTRSRKRGLGPPAEGGARPWTRRRTARRPRSAGSSAGRSGRARSQSRPTRPKASSHELPDGVHLAGGDDVVVGRRLLEHPPHRLDVLGRVAPVAPGVEVAEVEVLVPCRPGSRRSPRVTLRVTNVGRRGGATRG